MSLCPSNERSTLNWVIVWQEESLTECITRCQLITFASKKNGWPCCVCDFHMLVEHLKRERSAPCTCKCRWGDQRLLDEHWSDGSKTLERRFRETLFYKHMCWLNNFTQPQRTFCQPEWLKKVSYYLSLPVFAFDVQRYKNCALF